MMSNTAWMYIFMMFFGLFLGSVSGYADTGSRTFYYALEASSTPTGYGKVYATTSSNAPSESDYKATDAKNGSAEGGYVSFIGTTNYPPTVNFNFYALANDGYAFSYWRAKGTTASVSTSNPYSVSKEISSTSNTSDGRTPVKYQAVFVKINGLVKVKSADISKGSATIDNPNNGIDDEVRLTAVPVEGKGIVLLGWKKEGGSDEYITEGNGYHIEDNSLIFTVTSDNKGTYVAYFSDEAHQSFYRIRNKATGKFLCLTGSSNAAKHNATIQGYSRQDGYTFTNSLTLVDDNASAQCNPGTVFKFTGAYDDNGNLKSTTLSSQGVSLSSLSENHTFTIEPYQGNYRIYTTFRIAVTNGVNINVPSYLCGVSTPTLMSTYNGNDFKNDVWELFPLTENSTTEAFGANAQQKYTQDGMYYTSMYAPFPYKLLDGVKAYYLPLAEGVYHESTNTIVFSEVTSGIVPANTPVILECKNYNGPSSNRLLPLTDDEEIPVLPNANLNFLKGYLDLNGNKVQNDHDKMYVFSISDVNNKLGFYHFSKDYMTPHKAYLQLPMSLSEFEEQYKEKANNAKFAFRFESEETPTPTIIELSNTIVEDDDMPVFDLQGRKVQPNKAGIYIKKGKKFVVK